MCNESKLEAVLARGDSEGDCSPWLCSASEGSVGGNM